MMANDPELSGQIEEMIKNESCNAEFATETVANMMISMFWSPWTTIISRKEPPMSRTLHSV